MPRTQAARVGLLAKEEARCPGSWRSSDAGDVRAPRRPQPGSRGQCRPPEGTSLLLIFLNSNKPSQNLCFLELLALLFR